jgi:hypothetical protein
MLGRLQMDVETCISAYCKLSEMIFPEKHGLLASFGFKGKDLNFLRGKPWFDAGNLEKALKAISKEQLGDEAALLLDPKDTSPACKV